MSGNWLELYWLVMLRQKALFEEAEHMRMVRDMKRAARRERAGARRTARQLRSSQAARASLAVLQDCGKTGGSSVDEGEGARVSGDC